MSVANVRSAVVAIALVVASCSLWTQGASQPQTSTPSDQAQQSPTMPPTHQHMGASKSVTGCLQKGDQEGEYSITGDDGKKWGLRSTHVKLEEHVGHKVTVTGMPKKANASDSSEAASMTVRSLKMVSTTCP